MRLKVEPVQVEVGVHAVARRARDVCDDVPLVAHQRVDEGALPTLGRQTTANLGKPLSSSFPSSGSIATSASRKSRTVAA